MTNYSPKPESASPQTSDQKFAFAPLRFTLLELALLLSLWFFYGGIINSRNLEAFNLQHAGVEAIVERRQFSLQGSEQPRFQIKVYFDGDKPFGDTFLHDGRQYAAKQPGQFFAGAFVYFFLRLFGLSYLNNYFLTSALVTFFTSSLVTAAAAVAVFRIVRELTARDTLIWPLGSAFSYGLATTAFVYSGITYHDVLASGYLVIAFYLIVLLARQQPRGRAAKVVAGAAGFLLGMTITTSMLPFFLTCVLAGYFLWLRRWDLTPWALVGGFVGLAPLLFFNAVSFGNPFLTPYIAGGYPESFLRWDPHNSLQKIGLYVWEITLYVPIVWMGIPGLAGYPRALRREVVAMLALFLAMAIQVLNIDSHGGCHYGPRFLLPIMPYACIGLAGCSYLRAPTSRLMALIAIALAAATSFVVNFVGALYGAMYCETDIYAFWRYFGQLQNVRWRELPLASWLVAPFVLSTFLLGYSIWTKRRVQTSTQSLPADEGLASP